MGLAPFIAEEATFGIAELGMLMALIGLLTLRFTWSMTFGPLFQQIAKLLDVPIGVGFGPSLHPFGFLANALRALDNFVYRSIGKGISETEYAWHKLLLWNAYVLTKTGDAIAGLTYDVLAALHIVNHKTSAAALRAVQVPVVKQYTATLPKVTVVTESRVPALQREIAATNARIDALQHSIALPAPIAIPRTLPKVGELERGIEWVKGEAKRLKKYGTVAGLLGITAAVLGRLGLGWTRCSKVGRTGKQLCGMDESLLESLLADTLLIVGTVSLVEFAQGMQGITAEVAPAIRTFWRAT